MQTHLSKGAQNLQHGHFLRMINEVFHYFTFILQISTVCHSMLTCLDSPPRASQLLTGGNEIMKHTKHSETYLHIYIYIYLSAHGVSSRDLSNPCLLTSGVVAGLGGAHGGREPSQPHCEAQDVQHLSFASICIDHSNVNS